MVNKNKSKMEFHENKVANSFQDSIEAKSKTDHKSNLLLQAHKEKQHDKEPSTRKTLHTADYPLTEEEKIQITPTTEAFLRHGHNSSESKECFDTERQSFLETGHSSKEHSTFKHRKESSANRISRCYQKENRSVVPCSDSSATFKNGIVVFLQGACGQQGAKLIDGNNGVVVYEATKLDNSLLKPVVQCFVKNMEVDVPKELV